MIRMNVQQIHDLYLRVVAVGRQEVNLLARFLGNCYQFLQFGHRGSLCDAHLSGQISHAGHEAHPHNVVDVDVPEFWKECLQQCRKNRSSAEYPLEERIRLSFGYSL